jgi:hypothetical protein
MEYEQGEFPAGSGKLANHLVPRAVATERHGPSCAIDMMIASGPQANKMAMTRSDQRSFRVGAARGAHGLMFSDIEAA